MRVAEWSPEGLLPEVLFLVDYLKAAILSVALCGGRVGASWMEDEDEDEELSVCLGGGKVGLGSGKVAVAVSNSHKPALAAMPLT